MTIREADKAINFGAPVTVRDSYGDVFVLILTARDRRTVEGTYTEGAETRCGKFERGSLTVVRESV
jgi:hypothetical protein